MFRFCADGDITAAMIRLGSQSWMQSTFYVMLLVFIVFFYLMYIMFRFINIVFSVKNDDL